jgi:hypothetical protein
LTHEIGAASDGLAVPLAGEDAAAMDTADLRRDVAGLRLARDRLVPKGSGPAGVKSDGAVDKSVGAAKSIGESPPSADIWLPFLSPHPASATTATKILRTIPPQRTFARDARA